jgi:two-component system, cell cycle response regulator CtrA
MPAEEQGRRKRAVIRGPKEFRELRICRRRNDKVFVYKDLLTMSLPNTLATRALGQPTDMRILLVEDDSATARSIELMLKSESFNFYTTDLGEEGIDLGKIYDYDIILLDLNLPDMSGFEVLRSLRVSKVKTPVLILTGLAAIEDKVRGFGFGADDYLTKPFNRSELVARIHALVRRSKGHAQSVIQIGDLVVDVDAKKVDVNGVPVYLTAKEYKMLELLALRKDMTITKETFLNYLYDGMNEPEAKIIDVFMCKVRKKLAGASGGIEFIETVWGRGYVLREPAEAVRRPSAQARAGS